MIHLSGSFLIQWLTYSRALKIFWEPGSLYKVNFLCNSVDTLSSEEGGHHFDHPIQYKETVVVCLVKNVFDSFTDQVRLK